LPFRHPDEKQSVLGGEGDRFADRGAVVCHGVLVFCSLEAVELCVGEEPCEGKRVGSRGRVGEDQAVLEFPADGIRVGEGGGRFD